MNRRGFIAALASLVPASLLPAPKPEPVREWKAVRSPEVMIYHPNHEENVRRLLAESTEWMVGEMSALGESFGNSYNLLKSRTASKIMARADRRYLNRKL